MHWSATPHKSLQDCFLGVCCSDVECHYLCVPFINSLIVNLNYHWDFMAIIFFWMTSLGFLKVSSFGSANAHLPRSFRPLNIPFENWIEPVIIGLLHVMFRLSFRIFYRGVSSFVTDCPCGVWCRGLTTCLLHIGPLYGYLVLNDSRFVSLT